MQAPVCVKKDDQYVSTWIINNVAWEEDNVALFMKTIGLYDDAVFVGKKGGGHTPPHN